MSPTILNAPTLSVNKGFVKPNALSVLVADQNTVGGYVPVEFVVTGYDPTLDKFSVMNYTLNDVSQYISGEGEFIIVLKFEDFTSVSCNEYQVSVVISYCQGVCGPSTFALSSSSAVLTLPFAYIAAPIIDSAYMLTNDGYASALIRDPALGVTQAPDRSINGYSVIVHQSLNSVNTMSGQFNLPFDRVTVGGEAYNLVTNIPIPLGGSVSLAARAVNETALGQVNVSPISNTYHLDQAARPLPPASVSAVFNEDLIWQHGDVDWTSYTSSLIIYMGGGPQSVLSGNYVYQGPNNGHYRYEDANNIWWYSTQAPPSSVEVGDVITQVNRGSRCDVTIAPADIGASGLIDPVAVEIRSGTGALLGVFSALLEADTLISIPMPDRSQTDADQLRLVARFMTTDNLDTAMFSNPTSSVTYTMAAPATISASFATTNNYNTLTASITVTPLAPCVGSATLLPQFIQIYDERDILLALEPVAFTRNGPTTLSFTFTPGPEFEHVFRARYLTTSEIVTAIFGPYLFSESYVMLRPVDLQYTKDQNSVPVANHVIVGAASNPSLIGRTDVSIQMFRDDVAWLAPRLLAWENDLAAEEFVDQDAMEQHDYRCVSYVGSLAGLTGINSSAITIAAADAPPGPASVTVQHALVNAASNLRIQWAAAVDNSLAVDHYLVFVDEALVANVSASVFSYDYQVIPSAHSYSAAVCAVGVNTLQSLPTLADAISMPIIGQSTELALQQQQTDASGNSHVLLSWLPPANAGEQADQAFLMGYTINVGSLVPQEVVIETGTGEFTVIVTETGVASQSMQAQGTSSTASEPIWFPSVPIYLPASPPQQLLLTSTKTEIRANWGNPLSNGGGAPDSFLATLINNSGERIMTVSIPYGDGPYECEFSGLAEDALYTVEVSLSALVPVGLIFTDGVPGNMLFGQVASRQIDTVGPPVVTMTSSALPSTGDVQFNISSQTPRRNLVPYADMRFVYYVPVLEAVSGQPIDAFTAAPVINVLADHIIDTPQFSFVFANRDPVKGNQYTLTVKHIDGAEFIGFIIVVVTIDQSSSFYVPADTFVTAYAAST